MKVNNSSLDSTFELLSKVSETEDNKEQILYLEKAIDDLNSKGNLISYPFINIFALKSMMYGNLSHSYILDKQFIEAERAAKEALRLDSSAEWSKVNLGFAYVLQGKYVESEQIFTDLKDRLYGSESFKHLILDELLLLEKKGIVHQDFDEIRTLLK